MGFEKGFILSIQLRDQLINMQNVIKKYWEVQLQFKLEFLPNTACIIRKNYCISCQFGLELGSILEVYGIILNRIA